MKLDNLNTLVIKQEGKERLFTTSSDGTLIIDISSLSNLLKYLVFTETISHKILEGILEEYHNVLKGS